MKLPSVLRGADAGLIPYAINELTKSIFPMKVYEYMAAGLSVIATPLPALAGIEEVATAADAAGIAALIEEALAAAATAQGRHAQGKPGPTLGRLRLERSGPPSQRAGFGKTKQGRPR